MSSISGLVPYGLKKRSAIAVVSTLLLIFHSEEESEDVKTKIFYGRILPFVHLTTKVMRLGGMIDASTRRVVRRLFECLIGVAPENMRQHTEDSLVKDNEAFFSG